MMDFQERLDKMIAVAGSFNDIKWTTMYEKHMTLGTMSDNHVENCIQYHKGVVLMAECTPSMYEHLEAASFIVFLMTKNKEMRETV
jgi:hypothetical protein